LYVALTRAIRVLEINQSLAEIMDKYKIKYVDTRFDDRNTGTLKDELKDKYEGISQAVEMADNMLVFGTIDKPAGATTVHIAKGRPAGGIAQFHMDDYSKAVERFIGGPQGDMAQFANEGEERWIGQRIADGYSMADIEQLPF
jgi:hypothetical protein